MIATTKFERQRRIVQFIYFLFCFHLNILLFFSGWRSQKLCLCKYKQDVCVSAFAAIDSKRLKVVQVEFAASKDSEIQLQTLNRIENVALTFDGRNAVQRYKLKKKIAFSIHIYRRIYIQRTDTARVEFVIITNNNIHNHRIVWRGKTFQLTFENKTILFWQRVRFLFVASLRLSFMKGATLWECKQES